MIELKPFICEDFDRLIGWINTADILVQWAGPIFNYPLDIKQLELYLKSSEGTNPSRMIFKAINSRSGNVIGHIELDEINYTRKSAMLSRVLIGDPEMRGKGYGQIMINELLKFAFSQLSLCQVNLFVFEFNTPAISCYKKIGFFEEVFFSDAYKIGDKDYGIYDMKILNSQWFEYQNKYNNAKDINGVLQTKYP